MAVIGAWRISITADQAIGVARTEAKRLANSVIDSTQQLDKNRIQLRTCLSK